MDSAEQILKKATQFVSEGDGAPGFDVPWEDLEGQSTATRQERASKSFGPVEDLDSPAEAAEVAIANEIIAAINAIDKAHLSGGKGLATASGRKEVNQKIDAIRAAASKLKKMHSGSDNFDYSGLPFGPPGTDNVPKEA